MQNENHILAVVPMRAKSKGIPGKNIRLFGGKPLCWWMLHALEMSEFIDNIVVLTDCTEIRKTVLDFNFSKVILENRSSEVSADNSSTESVLLEWLTQNPQDENDIIVLGQVTSPLIQFQDVDNALKCFLQSEYDSLLTGVLSKRFFWDKQGKPMNYDPSNRQRRQDFSGQFMENGALYISKVKNIMESKCRISGNIGVYEMPSWSGIEMDEPEDWMRGEFCLKQYFQPVVTEPDLESSLGSIKILIMDVDGVLTDTAMFYTEKGDELKRFSCRDGMGIKMLREKGIKTAIITSENTEMVSRRALKLEIDFLFQGIWNKDEVAEYICEQEGISLCDAAFVGDDVNDIPVLRKIGYAFCPVDAVSAVKEIPGIHVLENKGGNGAVRELCEKIIQNLK